MRYLARRFRDAGFEVVFTNFLVAGDIIATALQEDVDVIGVSSSSGGHMPVFEELREGMRTEGLDDVLVIAGGTPMPTPGSCASRGPAPSSGRGRPRRTPSSSSVTTSASAASSDRR
ncbi:MAG: cobalamin B12-binding domain-containing protein [Candidatus Dormibacteria bacterium]